MTNAYPFLNKIYCGNAYRIGRKLIREKSPCHRHSKSKQTYPVLVRSIGA